MSPTAVLHAFQMMLGSAAMVLDNILLSKKYRHADAYREALETGARILEDFSWVVRRSLDWDRRAGRIYLGAPPEDNPEVRIEAMETAKEFYRKIIARWLRGFPGISLEDEERFQELALNAMQAAGEFMRENRRILEERWPYSWTEELELRFHKYLKLKGKRSR